MEENILDSCHNLPEIIWKQFMESTVSRGSIYDLIHISCNIGYLS